MTVTFLSAQRNKPEMSLLVVYCMRYFVVQPIID